MGLRVIFMGTPEYSVPTLTAIAESGHKVLATYTQPPRRAGRRGLRIIPSPVHSKADELGIPVITTSCLNDQKTIDQFRIFEADVAVVVAYGLLLPKLILELPKAGCLNAHASLLPRWRGAAPIQRAIEAGDRETGAVIMQMNQDLDSGPIVLTEKIKIGNNTTSSELHNQLSKISARIVLKSLKNLESGILCTCPQSTHGVTYAKKINKPETRIDWRDDTQAIQNKIRAFSSIPGCWFEIPSQGKLSRIKVLHARVVQEYAKSFNKPGTILDSNFTVACGNGALRITKLQRTGKSAMSAEEYLRGNPLTIGTVLKSAGV